MKKILILSYYFPPYGGGSVIRIHNFVKYLTKFGFLPIVLTLKEKYYEKTYLNPELLDEYSKEVKIIRTNSFEPKGGEIKDKIYGLKKKTGMDRLLFSIMKYPVDKVLIPDRNILWAPFALLKGIDIINKNKIDLIFATSPPFSTGVIAFLLHKLKAKPYVLDFRDDWIGNKFYGIHNGYLRSGLEKKFEYLLIKKASKVITATKETIDHFKEKYPKINEDKYRFLRNGYDPECFKENNSIDYLKGDLKDQKINFTHTGSLTIKRNPLFFLQAIKEILKENPSLKNRLRISFIGFTHYEHKELIKSLNLSDIVFFFENMSPRKTADFLQSETDVCLIFQRKSEGGNTAIPGKLYEYLACRKPILCMDDNGATTDFLKDIGSKLNANYEDIAKIKHLIEMIIDNFQDIKKDYAWEDDFLNQFSRKKQAEKLAKVFNKLEKTT